MTKIIKVDSCEHCPFVKRTEIYDYNPDIKCTHIKTEHKDIEDDTKIPDWCPLEDQEEDNKMPLQKEYCLQQNVPLYVSLDGKCGYCGRTQADTYTVHITGCPHCHKSFL